MTIYEFLLFIIFVSIFPHVFGSFSCPVILSWNFCFFLNFLSPPLKWRFACFWSSGLQQGRHNCTSNYCTFGVLARQRWVLLGWRWSRMPNLSAQNNVLTQCIPEFEWVYGFIFHLPRAKTEYLRKFAILQSWLIMCGFVKLNQQSYLPSSFLSLKVVALNTAQSWSQYNRHIVQQICSWPFIPWLRSPGHHNRRHQAPWSEEWTFGHDSDAGLRGSVSRDWDWAPAESFRPFQRPSGCQHPHQLRCWICGNVCRCRCFTPHSKRSQPLK